MLIATNLSKKFVYKESKGLFKKKLIVKNAVNDVSLKIESGKIVGLIGVNGAGKTTTIKMLASLIKPTTGEILIDNLDIIKEHKKAKRIINLISGGERNIYWRLTAQENLEYFGALYGIPKDVLNQKIETILEMVGLTESKDIPVERYSKGMKQRLQIARGLINDPKYIFLDEPTLGLDINIAKELRSYIRKLADDENKGILLTTHYISEVEELCDYIYIISNGYIVAEGTPDELKEELSTKTQVVLTVEVLTEQAEVELKDILECKAEVTIEGENIHTIKVISKENFTAEIIRCLSSHNVSILNMKLMEPDLEEIVLNVLRRSE